MQRMNGDSLAAGALLKIAFGKHCKAFFFFPFQYKAFDTKQVLYVLHSFSRDFSSHKAEVQIGILVSNIGISSVIILSVAI